MNWTPKFRTYKLGLDNYLIYYQMKTVLQILPSLRKINGGVERGTLDIAKELAEKDLGQLLSPLEIWAKNISIKVLTIIQFKLKKKD